MTSAHSADIGRLLPPCARGMRIGLFGGTFDPPHKAHVGATLLALKRLRLDRVWWLVTPGNPLKDTSSLAPLEQRIAAARKLIDHPRIDVTGFEAAINTRYSYDTILWLVTRYPGVRFVWIMGADNLRSFHRWQRWRDIARLVPIVVVDRLGPSLYASAGAAGQAMARARIPEHEAESLAGREPPAWVYLHGLKSPLSSTALRAIRRKQRIAPGAASKKKSGKKPAKARTGKRAKPVRKKTRATRTPEFAKRNRKKAVRRGGGKKRGK